MNVALTGHRPRSIGWSYDYHDERWTAARQWLSEALWRLQPQEVISGMALGWDIVGALTAHNDGWNLHAAIPCDGQDTRWPQASKQLYHDLLEHAYKRTVVSPGPYAVWKMQRRNEFMVDNSDLLIAFWNGEPGGTGNCVRYAEKQGKQILQIRPSDYETT